LDQSPAGKSRVWFVISPIDIASRKAIDLRGRTVGAVDRHYTVPDVVEFASGDASRTGRAALSSV